MVTKEQFMNGVILYIDREVMPALSTAGKWGMGTVITLAKNKADTIIDQLVNNSVIKMLGVTTCEGLIDNDALMCALKENAEKYGKLLIEVPFLGNFTFSCEDIDKLKGYIAPNNMIIGGISNG